MLSLIFTLNSIILLAILVIAVSVNYISGRSRKAQQRFHQAVSPLNRQFGYFGSLANDALFGKDIRIFRMQVYIGQKIREYNDKIVNVFGEMYAARKKYSGLGNGLPKIQMTLIYAYLAWKVLRE